MDSRWVDQDEQQGGRVLLGWRRHPVLISRLLKVNQQYMTDIWLLSIIARSDLR